MREFVTGVELGAVAALLILAAVWLERVANDWHTLPFRRLWRRLTHRGRRKAEPPLPALRAASPKGGRQEGIGSHEKDKQELDKLTARVGMRNFYLYDGSPQRDPRETARDYFERKVK